MFILINLSNNRISCGNVLWFCSRDTSLASYKEKYDNAQDSLEESRSKVKTLESERDEVMMHYVYKMLLKKIV